VVVLTLSRVATDNELETVNRGPGDAVMDEICLMQLSLRGTRGRSRASKEQEAAGIFPFGIFHVAKTVDDVGTVSHTLADLGQAGFKGLGHLAFLMVSGQILLNMIDPMIDALQDNSILHPLDFLSSTIASVQKLYPFNKLCQWQQGPKLLAYKEGFGRGLAAASAGPWIADFRSAMKGAVENSVPLREIDNAVRAVARTQAELAYAKGRELGEVALIPGNDNVYTDFFKKWMEHRSEQQVLSHQLRPSIRDVKDNTMYRWVIEDALDDARQVFDKAIEKASKEKE